jgi:hypothetical protein
VSALCLRVALEQFAHLAAKLVFPVLGIRIDDVVRNADHLCRPVVEDGRNLVLVVVRHRRPERVFAGSVEEYRAQSCLDRIREQKLGRVTPRPKYRALPGDAVVERQSVFRRSQARDDRRPEFVRAGFAAGTHDRIDGL